MDQRWLGLGKLLTIVAVTVAALDMEPVSLALGVAGLAAGFGTCMDCFEYVQIGRNFGNDFEKCMLRLDVVRLLSIPEKDLLIAQNLLEEIQSLFQSVENSSKSYKRRAVLQQSTTTDLSVYDPGADMTPIYSNVHGTLRQIASQRQKETSFLKKTKWALYERRRFDELIRDLTDFVDRLIELFPFAEEEQNFLCREEVLAIKDSERLRLLDSVTEGSDSLLQTTLREELAHRGHLATDWSAAENSKVRIGDNNAGGVQSRGHTSRNFTVSGSADVWIGNQNRGT
ncbi:MAG: hypothetical protein M1833_007325 [Piccolia ochrophora]|nr:MAG: hypothetical protein M1833_007325 [Piccolia ochrophora]